MRKTATGVLALLILSALGSPQTSSRPSPGTVAGTSGLGLTGQWYGAGYLYITGSGANIGVYLDPAGAYAIVHVPELQLSHQLLPATFRRDSFVTWAGDSAFTGTLDGDVIAGQLWISGSEAGAWYAYREIVDLPQPGPGPGQPVGDLPPLYCVGDAAMCTELLSFEPDKGPGYLDYPINGEAWENQYRSYARRDLQQLVQYAAAKLEVKAADWDTWPFSPIGLGDMSEADGAIPGTSTGNPGHPPGSHEGGMDIDIAYYQLYAPDNHLRSVGEHHEGLTEVYHIVGEPYALDPWRTALFIAYLAEHPNLRVVGVDGQVGLVLEETLDTLVDLGWIDAEQRAAIPLAYEVEDTGQGWFRFHHHHMHVGMMPLDVLCTVDLKPETLNLNSQGRYITAYIELEALDVNGVDLSTVGLIVDGHTLIPAEAGHATVGDHDADGVPDLEVKFDRELVAGSIALGQVTVAITGTVDDGTWLGADFQGADTIRVIH